jgi:hypothetical protein
MCVVAADLILVMNLGSQPPCVGVRWKVTLGRGCATCMALGSTVPPPAEGMLSLCSLSCDWGIGPSWCCQAGSMTSCWSISELGLR